MKITDINQQSRPAEEVVSQTQVKKQVRHIGSIMPHEGHTLWEYDLNTLQLAPAQFSGAETIDFPLDGSPVKINKRVIVRENCIYLGTLNKKSALRKIEKTYHLSKQLYDQEYKTINAYLGAQISRWFDYAEKEGDSQKRTDLLLLLQSDWEKWIYAKNQHLHTYYRHLFMERWGQTIKMITKNKLVVADREQHPQKVISFLESYGVNDVADRIRAQGMPVMAAFSLDLSQSELRPVLSDLFIGGWGEDAYMPDDTAVFSWIKSTDLNSDYMNLVMMIPSDDVIKVINFTGKNKSDVTEGT